MRTSKHRQKMKVRLAQSVTEIIRLYASESHINTLKCEQEVKRELESIIASIEVRAANTGFLVRFRAKIRRAKAKIKQITGIGEWRC